jgi:hypothetical protein
MFDEGLWSADDDLRIVTANHRFTENGPDCDDEVNLIVLGANYGWGTADFCGGQPSGSYPAIKTFTPTIAPTGCNVYRGTRYTPALDGDLFFGSYNYGVLEHIKFVPGTVDQIALYEEFATFPEPLLDVTTGTDGYCGLRRARPSDASCHPTSREWICRSPARVSRPRRIPSPAASSSR